ncbi:MAG: TatD family hydrolase [Bacteroidales bacterium]|jgi:TatD DNase family protein
MKVMNLPQPGDYINMHTHNGKPAAGIFIIESLMAHEGRLPEDVSGETYTYGIHPWFLNENNHKQQIISVENIVSHPNIIAIGEAGFDKLRGPSPELQRSIFDKQVAIAEAHRKPVIIHCVKAWDELLSAQKNLKPQTPWMIHGFRGSVKLAKQLLSKGMHLSFWFDFVMRSESAELLKSLPPDRIFLETDGADIDIRTIYGKVAKDLDMSVDKLKSIVLSNFNDFFYV